MRFGNALLWCDASIRFTLGVLRWPCARGTVPDEFRLCHSERTLDKVLHSIGPCLVVCVCVCA